MPVWAWILIIIAAAILVAIFVGFYNRIVRAENRIDNAWGQIDVQLRRRADLVPNLVETVKGYAKHEREVLDSVTQARAGLMNARGPQESLAADNMLEQALGKLFAVAEAYPDLKANTNYLQLQDELTHTENKVAFARQHYNDAVLDFNNTIETFPGNVFAGMMGKREKEMLQIPVEAREVPKVSF